MSIICLLCCIPLLWFCIYITSTRKATRTSSHRTIKSVVMSATRFDQPQVTPPEMEQALSFYVLILFRTEAEKLTVLTGGHS